VPRHALHKMEGFVYTSLTVSNTVNGCCYDTCNASDNQRQRFFHLSTEPRTLDPIGRENRNREIYQVRSVITKYDFPLLSLMLWEFPVKFSKFNSYPFKFYCHLSWAPPGYTVPHNLDPIRPYRIRAYCTFILLKMNLKIPAFFARFLQYTSAII
jgi:hypothetical protein